MSTIADRATAVINDQAIESVAAAVRALLASGEAEWVEDPWCEDVVGLFDTTADIATDTPYLIVYLDGEDIEEIRPL